MTEAAKNKIKKEQTAQHQQQLVTSGGVDIDASTVVVLVVAFSAPFVRLLLDIFLASGTGGKFHKFPSLTLFSAHRSLPPQKKNTHTQL